MNNRDIPNETLKGTYLSPVTAEAAINTLRIVLERLGDRADTNRLRACIGFAQEALWAAAYPDDPTSMLDQIADQAQNAMG